MKIKKIEHIDTILFDDSTKNIRFKTHRLLASKIQISIFSVLLLVISFILFIAEIFFTNLTLGEISLNRLVEIIIIVYVLLLLFFRIVWSKVLRKNPYSFFSYNAGLMALFMGLSVAFLEVPGISFFIFNRANSFLYFEFFLAYICFYITTISMFILTWNVKIELRGLYNDIYATYTEKFRMFPFTITKHIEIFSDYENPLNIAISHRENVRNSFMSGEKYTLHYYTEQEFEEQIDTEHKYYALKVLKKSTTENFILLIGTKDELKDFLLKLTQLGKYLFITEKDLKLESDPDYPMFVTAKEVKSD